MKSLISEINCEIVHKKIPKVKHLHSTEAEKIKAMVHTQDPNFFLKKLITTGMKPGLILSVVDSFMYGRLTDIRAKFIPT